MGLPLRVLRTALSRPAMTELEADEIIEYHRRRNQAAQASRRKTPLKKHKKARFKAPL